MDAGFYVEISLLRKVDLSSCDASPGELIRFNLPAAKIKAMELP